MKRRALVLFAAATLVLGGCSEGVGSNKATEVSSDVTASQSKTSTAEFNGVTLEIPEQWSKKEDADKGTMEDVGCWVYAGDNEAAGYGPILVASIKYDAYGNTDTQIPNPSDRDQQEIKKKTDAGLKALDARVTLEMVAEGCMKDLGETIDVNQADFKLEESEGHAVWVYRRETANAAFAGCSIPFDDRVVAFYTSSAGDRLTADQEAMFRSIVAVEPSDGLLLDLAHVIEGKPQDEAVSKLLEGAQIPGSDSKGVTDDAKPESSSTSGKKDSTDSKKDDHSAYESPSGDTYVETDDGGVMTFSKDGSVTLHDKNGISTFNGDGTKEWTDGWGTVVRDENGDGKPDYVSYDSGETWQKTK